LQYLVCMRAT